MPELLAVNYPEKIDFILDAEGWNASEFARSLETDGSTVSRWRDGQNPAGPARKAIDFMFRAAREKCSPLRKLTISNLSNEARRAISEEAARSGRTEEDVLEEAVERRFGKWPRPAPSSSLAAVDSEDSSKSENSLAFTIPISGAVAAGKPISAPVEDELRVAREYPSDHGAYRVCGDSMTGLDGTGILDGDNIVVRHFPDGEVWSPGNNRIYIFNIAGELTLKRFVRGRKGASHRLVSDNPGYPDVEPDEDTVAIAEFIEVL